MGFKRGFLLIKKNLYILIFCSILSIFALPVWSQLNPNPPPPPNELDRYIERRRGSIFGSSDSGPSSQYRSVILPGSMLDSKEQKRVISMRKVDPADRDKYHDFLKGKNTGIFRLAPDFDCIENNNVRVDGKCANFVPISSFYMAYDIENLSPFLKYTEQTRTFYLMGNDKRADLIIVFRAVRSDDDRSITILWKQLQRKKAPSIRFEKDDTVGDFRQ